MNLNANEMIELFDGYLDQESEADEIKKDIREGLKSYAERIDASPKSIMSAYALFKKFKSGKNTQEECSDYSEMSTAIEIYFGTHEE